MAPQNMTLYESKRVSILQPSLSSVWSSLEVMSEAGMEGERVNSHFAPIYPFLTFTMSDLIPILSTILATIASTLLLLVLLANLYLKIRRKFSISVNCWFCNVWSRVAYDNRNSFNCPHCFQYNGFTEDGDYNRIISEQHDEFMNKSAAVKSNKLTATNGLCVLCNNNQKLKIFQLANFVPLDEQNYDVEIEHFQKQLENAYKLCGKCNKVLKKTIDKQNAWIFANQIKNKCTKSISQLTNRLRHETSSSLVSRFDGFFSVCLVVGVIIVAMLSAKVLTKNVALYVPKSYLTLYKSVVSLVNTSQVINLNLGSYFSKSIKLEPYLALCSVSFMFELVRVIRRRFSTATCLNRLLCWIILLLSSGVRFSKSYYVFVLFLQAFCCFYLLFTAFSKENGEQRAQKPGKTMRKLVKNLEYTCSDLSDGSDFEDVSSSSKNCTNSSRVSSDYLNKSHCPSLDVPLLNTAGNEFNSAFASSKSVHNFDHDINRSLNNLHLGGFGFKSPKSACSVASFALKRPKPVLSPPKFNTVNSWVAGGFWREGDGFAIPKRTNLSRSSSESSGFGSQHNEHPFTRGGYEYDEYSRLCPSPTYMYATRGFPEYRNAFYSGLIKYNEPYVRKNSFENWSDRINARATQNLRDLSLQASN